MTRWNRLEIETLIGLYESNQFLYDPKHEDYHNRAKRNRTLQQLANKIGLIRDTKLTVSEIKGKIKTLRTQYGAEKQHMLDKMIAGEYDEERYKPKLWCYENLKFLDTYTKDRTGNPANNLKEKQRIVTLPSNVSKSKLVEKFELEKEDVFASFVAAELKQITDTKLFHDTKWKIQLALKEGIEKQMDLNSEGLITEVII